MSVCLRVGIGVTCDEELIVVERYQTPQLSVDDPEQSVRLSFMSARCRATSSAMAAAIINRDPVRSADIEVLEKSSCTMGMPSVAAMIGCSILPCRKSTEKLTGGRHLPNSASFTLINGTRPRETSSQSEQVAA